MALDPNAPQTPPADPTATTGLAKKAPALPLAPAAPTASPTLSGSNPTATTQPVGPVTPAGPATTSDPMAFAPNGGGTPAITPDPVAAQAAPFQANVSGAPVTPGYTGWQDGLGNTSSGPATATGASATNIGDWYQAENGHPRYTTGADGNQIDNAMVTYNAMRQTMTPEQFAALGYGNVSTLDPSEQSAMQTATAADSYGKLHGGNNSPANNPNAGTLTQQANGTFTNAAGQTATQGGTLPTAPLNGMPGPTSKLTPGPANDVNPSGQLPWTPQVSATPTPAPSGPAGSTGGLNGMPATTTTSNGTVAMTPTDPAHSLMGQTLSVGPTADRFKLAQDEWDQAQKASEPAYEATLNAQDAHDFGMGRGVSGMHRNSIGDIASQRATAMDTQKKTFLDQALNSSVDDAYKNVGIEQQQQQFQQSLQEMAFQQGLSLQQLSDVENNQSFQQAYQKALLGFSGNPAQLYIQLAAEWAKTGATA